MKIATPDTLAAFLQGCVEDVNEKPEALTLIPPAKLDSLLQPNQAQFEHGVKVRPNTRGK